MTEIDARGEYGGADYWRVWLASDREGRILASDHERLHRILAQYTAWGIATSLYSVLAESRGGRFARVSQHLISRARNCHEGYATSLSLFRPGALTTQDGYPLYKRHADEALALVGHLPNVFGMPYLIDAAISACMSPPILQAVLDAGLASFSLSDVPDDATPDRRERRAAELPASEWLRAWQEICAYPVTVLALVPELERFPYRGWDTLCQPCGRFASADPDVVSEETADLFSQLAYSCIADMLTSNGVDTVAATESSETVFAELAQGLDALQLTAQDRVRLGFILRRAAHPYPAQIATAALNVLNSVEPSVREAVRYVTVHSVPSDPLEIAEQGRIVMRTEPRPARLLRFADLQESAWFSLTHGTPPQAYLFVLARRTWNLRQNYHFAADDLAYLPTEPNSTCTILRGEPRRHRGSPRSDDDQVVELVLLESPQELDAVASATQPRNCLSDVSLMTFDVDRDWERTWFGPLINRGPMLVRVDASPKPYLDAWCKDANLVRYAEFGIRDPQSNAVLNALIFHWSKHIIDGVPAPLAFAAIASEPVLAEMQEYLANHHPDLSKYDNAVVEQFRSWLVPMFTMMAGDQYEFRFHKAIASPQGGGR